MKTANDTSHQVELIIDREGRIVFIYDDDLALSLSELGVPVTKRASHVEPSTTHPGKWTADMSPFTGEPCLLGPFSTRNEALRAEIAFLRYHLSK